MLDHSNAARNAATDAVVDLVDQGSGTAVLQIRGGTTVLSEHNLSDPAFGDAGDGGADVGEAIANAIADATAGATGTADNYVVRDQDGTLTWEGTAGVAHDVAGVDEQNNQFQVSADLSSVLSPGDLIKIAGSTGNDGTYTVESISFDSPLTTITVQENVSDATSDGKVRAYALILDNTSITDGQTVSVDSLSHVVAVA